MNNPYKISIEARETISTIESHIRKAATTSGEFHYATPESISQITFGQMREIAENNGVSPENVFNIMAILIANLKNYSEVY